MSLTQEAPAGMIKNNQAQQTVVTQTANKPPRERYVLGTSSCYFEPADYLKGRLDVAAVTRMFANENTSIEPCEGKSLKVLFIAKNEIKFLGFITAGDATMELDESHVEKVTEHVTKEVIVKAVDVDELISMF